LFDKKRQPRPPNKKLDDRRRTANKTSAQMEEDAVDFSQASIFGEVLETTLPDCTKHPPLIAQVLNKFLINTFYLCTNSV